MSSTENQQWLDRFKALHKQRLELVQRARGVRARRSAPDAAPAFDADAQTTLDTVLPLLHEASKGADTLANEAEERGIEHGVGLANELFAGASCLCR